MYDACMNCHRDYDTGEYNCPYGEDCERVREDRERYSELRAEVEMENDFLARCDGE